MSKTKQLKEKIKILERDKFLSVYDEFNKWLKSLGFRQGHYWRESSTPMDYNFSHYDKYIDGLHGVEHYILDCLDFNIRFLRDRYEHRFMIVGVNGNHSKTFNIEKFKEFIKNKVIEMRDKKLSELETLKHL